MPRASVPREMREAAGLTDGLVSLSVGCEDLEDLWLDVEQALAAARSAQMGRFLGAVPPEPANMALDGRPQVS